MLQLKLKKCPFCGGNAKVAEIKSVRGLYIEVVCNSCGASSNCLPATDKNAIALAAELWNKRT
jgi:Lar family restriction alleviation protein